MDGYTRHPYSTSIAAFVAKLPAEITSVFRDVLLICDEQRLIGKELFAVDGCKLPSNASRTWSETRADLLKKAEKMEKAVGHMLDAHRRQDAGQNVDTLTQREQQQIETLMKNSRKIREWLAVSPEKTNRRGKPLKSNITDNESATMTTSHGCGGLTCHSHEHAVCLASLRQTCYRICVICVPQPFLISMADSARAQLAAAG